MKKKYIKIIGNNKINGEVSISGSKNSIVAILPASLLIKKNKINIKNVPNIEDVKSLIKLLNFLNIKTKHFKKKKKIIIDTKNIKNKKLYHPAITNLRASYYFMGVLLSRYKLVKIKMPGGCNLGPRPIDLHLKGFKSLGATYKYKHGFYIIKAKKLIGTKIYLDYQSVGATINILFASIYAKGTTKIKNAAKDPEIVDITTFLNEMGAKIRGAGTNTIIIKGVKKLYGGKNHEIIPDRIEAGTYIIAAAIIGKKIKIKNIITKHLESFLSKIIEIGVNIKIKKNFVIIKKKKKLKNTNITTQPYPGFPTDLQQPITTLLTQAKGISYIEEKIFSNRFKHVDELKRLGANIEILNSRIIIKGPTKLYGEKIKTTDLRCGASLIIAGLISKGVTKIYSIKHIDRGYEEIDKKLYKLNAKIYRKK